MADEQIKTGISAGNDGEMGDDGHVAPGGEMASMPGGPPKSQNKSQPKTRNENQKKVTDSPQEHGLAGTENA